MGTTRASISARVKMIFIEILGVKAADVADTAAIVDDLGTDPLKISQLSMLIEEEFGIFIAEESMEQLVTVGDVIDFVWGSKRLYGQ